MDSLVGNQPSSRKHTVVYTSATQNPFKTSPKDAPTRARDERPATRGSYNSGPRGDYGMNNQGFRGGRGGGFNRGGYNQNQYNRNFSGPMGGYNNNQQNHNQNHNQNQNMGFQGNMGMSNNYGGGFNNRGGMMGGQMRGGMGGMRGGRGGMNNMLPMGGGMMGNMGMNPMMAGMAGGMNMGFQGNQFNPGMFNAGPGANFGGDWNMHGAKRQRQE